MVLQYFLGVDNLRFCWGFWQKRGAERGFLMVNLWWIAGESWYVDVHFFTVRKFSSFPGFISGRFPFWEFSKNSIF